MQYAYAYKAKTENGQLVDGVVLASSRAQAMVALKRNGMKARKVSFDLAATISALRGVEFNPVELARLYNTLSRRIAKGKQLGEGLEQAMEYINDPNLRQAVIAMKVGIESGQDAHVAMANAGFPRRDAMMIRATSQAGKTSQAFASIASEVKQTAALRKSVKSVFLMPTIMAAFMAIFAWAAISFFAPITMEFLKGSGIKTSSLGGFLQGYFSFAAAFKSVWPVSSTLYFGGIVGLFVFLKSKTAKSFFEQWPALKELNMKTDQSALWNSYLQLYEAAISGPEAASLVASAASRDDSRLAFERLSAQLAAGAAIEKAVAVSGFPKYVVGGVSSAVSAGDLGQGLKDMVEMLDDDVKSATEKFKESIRLVSILVMAFAVLGVFMVTYYPILSATLKNA